MPKLDDLKKKGADQAAELRKLADKLTADGYAETAEDKANWDKLNADYNATLRSVEVEQKAADAEKFWQAGDPEQRAAVLPDRTAARPDPTPADKRPDVTDEHRAAAMAGWCRWQMGKDPTDEQRDAAKLVGLRLDARELEIPLLDTRSLTDLQREYRSAHPSVAAQRAEKIEFRTLSNVTGSTGAYLKAPTTLVRRLETNLLAFGGVSQVAETLTTTTGERMSWPTADDTSNTGAMLGESTSIGSSVDPSFTQIYWDAYKFSSKPILVPHELLEDSVFDLAGMIGEMFGERLGRIQNTKYTTGSGANEPKGLVTASALGVTAASATAIAADELFGLVHSIDPAYRGMGCGFMMHDSILLALRKLKDGDGQYLWVSGLSDGAPDRLLGYGITINQAMQSSIATATKTILFGLFNKYKIRRVNGLRMYRLQERYRDTDQDGFVGFIRADGNLLTAGTATVKHLLQA